MNSVQVNRKRNQAGQGMVEFALVLPILLMLVLGIMAFGHMFFSYTLVVAASREAARAGAAVGIGEHQVHRYRDCDMIRNTAITTGRFAGVENANIVIKYDQGVNADGSPIYYNTDPLIPDDCPAGAIGPGNIELGDRIEVTVTIMYRWITPIVDLGSFPMTAVTRRSIVKGMPVGDVEVAESTCIGTLTRILSPNFDATLGGSTLVYNNKPTFAAQVIPNKPGAVVPGTVYLYLDDLNYVTPFCQGPASATLYCDAQFLAQEWPVKPGGLPYSIRARYDPGPYDTTDPVCYQASKAEPQKHFTLPAKTNTIITSVTPAEPTLVFAGDVLSVGVQVDIVAPGGGVLTGSVLVSNGTDTCTIALTGQLGDNTGSCNLTMSTAGTDIPITAAYDPGLNLNYKPSSAAVLRTVLPKPVCPAFVKFTDGLYMGETIDFSTPDSMLVTLQNANIYPARISSVTVQWPTTASYLIDGSLVEMVSPNLIGISVSTVSLWTPEVGKVYGPGEAVIPIDPLIDAGLLPGDNALSTMKLLFDGSLPQYGSFSVSVAFAGPPFNVTCETIPATYMSEFIPEPQPEPIPIPIPIP